MWSTVFSKIWPQSVNASTRPTLKSNMLQEGNGRRALKVLTNRLGFDYDELVKQRDSSRNLKPFDRFASVINRRLI